MSSFWHSLKKPLFVLAPMADVTDCAFRKIIEKYSRPEGPDVFWTEFVSADGLIRAHEEGKKKLMRDLVFSEKEQPIVAQLFSANPEYMKQAAALVRECGFSGIDINMGCPDRSIEKQGAGAALIKNIDRAREVLAACREGAGHLPVSVKTRVGYSKVEMDTWIGGILAEKPAVLTVHARTRKEMSKVPARWEHVREAVILRDSISPDTLILGNGDALSVPDAKEKALSTGADGVMLGRAIFGNPWLFRNAEKIRQGICHEDYVPSVRERLEVALEHTVLFEEMLGDIKSFAVMKKHFKAYINGFEGAHELRSRLMETQNAEEVREHIQSFLAQIKKEE